MKFHKKLRLKKMNRTERKLVFCTKTGELKLVPENKIEWDDINIDQIFFAEGAF